MQHEVDGPMLIIHQHAVTDPEDIRRAMAAALADPALRPGSHLLWDASEAPARASADKMRSLLHFQGASAKLSNRCAMVVANDLQFGVARMFSVYAEEAGVTVQVFRDIAAAKAWLTETGA